MQVLNKNFVTIFLGMSLRATLNELEKDSNPDNSLLDDDFSKEKIEICQKITRTVSNNNFQKTETISRATSINLLRGVGGAFANMTPAAQWVAKYQQCVDNECNCYEYSIPTGDSESSQAEDKEERMQQLVERMNQIQQDMLELRNSDMVSHIKNK